MAGMTLTKLAKLANVSVSTASKAFSMSPEVNSETREMIFDKARELRSSSSFSARNIPGLSLPSSARSLRVGTIPVRSEGCARLLRRAGAK